MPLDPFGGYGTATDASSPRPFTGHVEHLQLCQDHSPKLVEGSGLGLGGGEMGSPAGNCYLRDGAARRGWPRSGQGRTLRGAAEDRGA
jgi:hypothetical protein